VQAEQHADRREGMKRKGTDKATGWVWVALAMLVLSALACGDTGASEVTQATVVVPPTRTPAPVATQPAPTQALTRVSTRIPATATPSVPPLEVRAGRDYLSHGYLHVVGEVVNKSDNWYDYVKIIGTFYDDGGTMIGTDFTYIELDRLGPQSTAPFNMAGELGGSAAAVAAYELIVQGDVTQGGDYTDLTAAVSNEYDSYGYHHMVGQVENVGETDCEYVKVVAAFYDADGNVVETDFTYTGLDVVPAGGKSPFELSCEVPAFDHYALWVEGDPTRGG
jgi:hypothetical protein